jgi:hypothetical protein
VSSHCTEVDGDIQVGGLAVAAAYPMDTDGDGTAEPHEYVLVTNAAGWLLIYVATDRAAVTQVGRIELPGPASAIVVDRLARKVYVAAGTAARETQARQEAG